MSDYTALAKKLKDGTVLLSIADDRICKLNGVGALTWITLLQSIDGISLAGVVEKLSNQFRAINSEGELRYEVSYEQLRDDTERFLTSLTKMNLLDVRLSSDEQRVYLVKEGVNGTISASNDDVECLPSQQPNLTSNDNTLPPQNDSDRDQAVQSSRSRDYLSANMKPSRREVFAAFLGLAAFDLILKLFGFQAMIKRVQRWPIAERVVTDPLVCQHICATVDRAQFYYPKKAMCLQHSAVVTCLLRRRGVPAEMVLAAQNFPPRGHAWVQVGDEVVNDRNNVRVNYRELQRI